MIVLTRCDVIWSDVVVMKLELLPSQTGSWHLRKGQNRAAWFVQSTHSSHKVKMFCFYFSIMSPIMVYICSLLQCCSINECLYDPISVWGYTTAAADINFTKKTWEFEKNYHSVSQVSHWLLVARIICPEVSSHGHSCWWPLARTWWQ